MNVSFTCPQCEQRSRIDFAKEVGTLACNHCDSRISTHAEAIVNGQLRRCLVCPSRDLYVRKDFPQRLGVLIVAIGFAASSVTWAYSWPLWTYAILFATALIDVTLYLLMPDALLCYHCGAEYRGIPQLDRYAAFDLETHERHRQQQIRLAEQKRVRAGAAGETAVAAGRQQAGDVVR